MNLLFKKNIFYYLYFFLLFFLRILLDYAIKCGGVVVSNDNFRDLYAEDIKYRDIIENR